MPDIEFPLMPLNVALEQLRTIRDRSLGREMRLTIRKSNPGGLSGHQTTDVVSLHRGIDWEGGQVIITPAAPLTELTQEQVDAIMTSVRKGGSWHAYQREEKLRARIKELEDRIEGLEEDNLDLQRDLDAAEDVIAKLEGRKP